MKREDTRRRFWAGVGSAVAVALVALAPAAYGFSFSSLFPEPEDYIYTGNMTFVFGERRLASSDWEPVERHRLYGVELDSTRNDWLVGWVARVLWSGDEGNTRQGGSADADFVEVAVGARKVWYELSKYVSPYVGVGGSFLSVDVSANGQSDEDRALGGWAEGGIYVFPLPNLSLGAFARYERIPVRVFGADADAGGWNFGVTLGLRWYDL